MKVLVVDDSDLLLEQIGNALSVCGHEVTKVCGIYKMPGDGTAQGIKPKRAGLTLLIFSEYAAAFLGYDLETEINGAQVMVELAKVGVKTCATSRHSGGRDLVLEAGAIISCPKDDVTVKMGEILARLMS